MSLLWALSVGLETVLEIFSFESLSFLKKVMFGFLSILKALASGLLPVDFEFYLSGSKCSVILEILDNLGI